MQQTETYKLNLIESSDTFSPDPLNENMEKIEAALSDAEEQLDQRVTVLETHKIVVGYHPGEGFVDLGFTPVVVFGRGNSSYGFAFEGFAMGGLSVVEGGFYHNGYASSCYYVAFV